MILRGRLKGDEQPRVGRVESVISASMCDFFYKKAT